MALKLLRFKNWLLLSVASVFGLQVECVGPDPDPEPPEDLYGCPEVEYDEKDSVIIDTVVEPL